MKARNLMEERCERHARARSVQFDRRAELVLLPVRARCSTCATAWDGDEIPLACPRCGAVEIEVVGGDELMLESIEYQG